MKKLTWEIVDEIRGYTNQKTAHELSVMYGVAASQIAEILRYNNWKLDKRPSHLPPPPEVIEYIKPKKGRGNKEKIEMTTTAEEKKPMLPECGNWQRIINSVVPEYDDSRLRCPV